MKALGLNRNAKMRRPGGRAPGKHERNERKRTFNAENPFSDFYISLMIV